MLRILLSLSLVFVFTTTSKANDLHLNLEERADEVLLKKPNGLTLAEVQKIVASEDKDVQIAYEKLLQAQKRIGEARAQFFPYGIGTVGAMYLLNIWNPILLVELITSIPSKVYNVQSERYMSLAEKHSLEALRENIKNQIAHLYYGIVKEETALKFTEMQIILNESMLKAYQERVALGMSTEEEVKEISRRIIGLRDAYLKFKGYLSAEKAAFNLMIARTPAEAKNIELQPVSEFLRSSDFNTDIDSMVKSAVSRSNEIIAADYMITAASKNRKAIKWSILSFQGVGFGYWGRVNVAGSQIEEARLNRQLVEENLVNQVYIAEMGLEQALLRQENQEALLADTHSYWQSELQRFINGVIPMHELIETELLYLKDYHEYLMAHYGSLTKLSDLERVVQDDVRSSVNKADQLEVKMSNYRRNWYSLSVGTAGKDKIKSVAYTFDDYLQLYPMTSTARMNDFAVNVKLYSPDFIGGTVTVTFENGNTATKTFRFE